MSALILIAADDVQVRRLLRASFHDNGYQCREARTCLETLEMMRLEKPDLILLDFSTSQENNLNSCKSIRMSFQVPIIVLSIRDQDVEKVAVLDAGANDYLTKPFSMPELLARARVALRRVVVGETAQPRFVGEELEVDFDTRTVRVRGKKVRLTPKELELLRVLILHADKPLPHRELLQLVWGQDHGQELEYLRVFINQLRKKIEPEPGEPRFILTEPCVGYRFAGIAKSYALLNPKQSTQAI